MLVQPPHTALQIPGRVPGALQSVGLAAMSLGLLPLLWSSELLSRSRAVWMKGADSRGTPDMAVTVTTEKGHTWLSAPLWGSFPPQAGAASAPVLTQIEFCDLLSQPFLKKTLNPAFLESACFLLLIRAPVFLLLSKLQILCALWNFL